MPLNLDYRPTKLEDFVGNKEVISSIQDMLNRKDKMPHSILLHGPSGCGKTTLARIIARELGAHGVDLKEMNSADFRGIDTARDIQQQMRLIPLVSDVKAWLLDECHKLTSDAQEAFLKALEEAPKHVFFILATTNPEKLRPTLRRRCATFEVRPLSEKKMVPYLQQVCAEEKKYVREKFLIKVAESSRGSLGFALMALEKIISMKDEKDVDRLLKLVEEQQNQAFAVCQAMNRQDWKQVSAFLKTCELEPEEVRRLALSYFNSVLLNSGSKRAAFAMKAFSQPFYETGKPGLTLACYKATFGLK